MLFTSEQVSCGHPDKICDQIADAVLTDCLRHDPESRVAVECLVKENIIVLGGSFADTGVTGRKIMCDTYGGAAHHGGGAFSGKDPTKVDRSAAYMARKIARDFVRYGYARRCEIQLAYAIGMKEPVSVNVNCFGTASVTEIQLARMARRQYDLTPAGIISMLDLQAVDYTETSAYGHFGKPWFPWEK